MKAKTTIYDSAEGYDLAASDYDKKESYLNSFEKGCWKNVLTDLVGKDVLDVGAGTGRLSTQLLSNGAKVTALDLSIKMLEKLKRKSPAIDIIQADAEDLPFHDESFHLVTAAFVVVHLKNPDIFFQEAYRVLRPGGQLIITNINQKEAPPVKTNIGTIKIKSYYHKPEKLKSLLEESGFSVSTEQFVNEREVWVNQIIVSSK
jgi:demethylmenaquinone methyltransferase/2-methoxy-6-polyprenyl-1,4-benzoquinol methylase